MAHFKSIVTDYGARILSEVLATGGKLTLTAAAAGKGRYSGDPAQITALAEPVNVKIDLGEMTYAEGTGVAWIPVQISNEGLNSTIPIREVAIYASHGGASFIFGYSWADGADSDNVLEPSRSAESADTVHIQDVGLFITNQEAAAITVQLGGGSYISREELYVFAAEREHTHAAAEIVESTGESTEIAQRRQDYDIAAMKEQLDTGFTGTTVTHTVAATELENWTGYDGTGYPEGIYDESAARLYA